MDVVFSFDTTGSMYPCLSMVRRRVTEMATRLFADIDDLNIGIIAHGDYVDANTSYVLQMLHPTNNVDAVVKFVNEVGKTSGGDIPECYEYMFHMAKNMMWKSDQRALVVIGDATPHPIDYKLNIQKLDWRNELADLIGLGVTVYPVQCLNRTFANAFYKEIALTSGTPKLTLDQFANVEQLLVAICYQESPDHSLADYAKELSSVGIFNRDIANFIRDLSGATVDSDVTERPFGAVSLDAVPPHRFQILYVDDRVKLKEFVVSTGANFKVGRGFYEFASYDKPQMIQEKKEVVLVDRVTGDMFTGPVAREMIGLPYGNRARLTPRDFASFDYDIFVQSTSWNRVLTPGSRFLYEVEDWDSS